MLAIIAVRDPSLIVKIIGIIGLVILLIFMILAGRADAVDRFLNRIGWKQAGNWGIWAVIAAGFILPTVGLTFMTCGENTPDIKRVPAPDIMQDASIHKSPDNNPQVAIQPDAQATLFPDAANVGRQCVLEIEPSCEWMRNNKTHGPGSNPWDHEVFFLCASMLNTNEDVLELHAGSQSVLESTDELALRTVPDESSECEFGSIVTRLSNDKTSKQTWPFAATETPTYYCLTALVNNGSRWPSSYEEYMRRRSAPPDSSDGFDAAPIKTEDDPDASNKPAIFYSNTLRIRKLCK